ASPEFNIHLAIQKAVTSSNSLPSRTDPNTPLPAPKTGARCRQPGRVRISVRTRMQGSTSKARATPCSPDAQPAPPVGTHRREWSLREPCSSAEGGAGASRFELTPTAAVHEEHQ